MVSLITCDVSFGQHIYELVFGVNSFDSDLGVRIDFVKLPNQRNSVSSCLIVGLLPLMIILITASLSSKMYN